MPQRQSRKVVLPEVVPSRQRWDGFARRQSSLKRISHAQAQIFQASSKRLKVMPNVSIYCWPTHRIFRASKLIKHFDCEKVCSPCDASHLYQNMYAIKMHHMENRFFVTELPLFDIAFMFSACDAFRPVLHTLSILHCPWGTGGGGVRYTIRRQQDFVHQNRSVGLQQKGHSFDPYASLGCHLFNPQLRCLHGENDACYAIHLFNLKFKKIYSPTF